MVPTFNTLRSSTFRLALLYMGLSSASVLILLGFIYWATAGYMDRQTDITIDAEIQGLAEQYRQRGLAGLTRLLEARVAKDPVGSSVYLLTHEDFTPIIGNLNRWPEEARVEAGWLRFRLRDWGADAAEHQARARSFVLFGGLRLLVGRDVRELEATRGLILEAFTWGLALTAGLAVLGGTMMSSGMLKRIEAINQTSREIMAGDLGRRIPTNGSGDDFDQLAHNLNRMLERIMELMQSVRQVSDNIAHDLRTPLTRLRSRLELAQAQLNEPGPASTAVEQAIADADALLQTFNALLRIARIESRGQPEGGDALDLPPLLQDLVELYEPLAADKEQNLVLTTPAEEKLQVRGDRDLLFQAMANLLDNAIKYSPPGGAIRVEARRQHSWVELRVADSGPGIPEAERDKVFDRFFRLESSRTTPGSGLGLSLVQAVVKMHRGRIRLLDNQPGLLVVAEIPAA